MKFTALLMMFSLAFSQAANVVRPGGDHYHQYEQYLRDYNKHYSNSSEYWSHYYNFANNLERIENHNSGNHSWRMGINNFTDLSFSDFRKLYLGARPPQSSPQLFLIM